MFIFVIPLGCINYLPAVAILGRPNPLGTPLWLHWAAPLAGPPFMLCCL
jgi:ABC-2 type transport system permease protein